MWKFSNVNVLYNSTGTFSSMGHRMEIGGILEISQKQSFGMVYLYRHIQHSRYIANNLPVNTSKREEWIERNVSSPESRVVSPGKLKIKIFFTAKNAKILRKERKKIYTSLNLFFRNEKKRLGTRDSWLATSFIIHHSQFTIYN